ncbi:sugar transferase [Effusibacillus lacus]|uniref:Sugar transferase n=1 Tax=Effusibacillus lacus TaxID=1348429 RepID=A0A292YTH0_9BACL|nr:sugar transferase [Effusibacillus lacus]TCS73734.1 O-antigen biosynthesis protein WbqP [Effusibacillus lacus]GAX92053.1 sugar transferase [Effusibacillus lacus]
MYNYLKRTIDFSLAIVSLVLLSPLFLMISILIKIESKGPIFFTQKRAGQDGRLFTIYKFRSMRIDTPNVATDKLGDPSEYVTRVGRFIRKTSLDELPQLINILRGDMSFVGPRPALFNQYELIEERQRQGIHRIKPGLTGYAQIMGRDYICDEQKVAYDRFYLEHMSLSLDFKILFLTFFKVMNAENVKG